MDELKNKIFYHGLFGSPIQNFNKEEIELARECESIEIVTKEQIDNLKNNFNLECLESVKINSTDLEELSKIENNNSQIYVRMNTVAWRIYAVGEAFCFKSEVNFKVLDFLIKSKDFVETASIRHNCQILPKNLFSILKVFKKHNLIEEKIIDSIKYVKYIKIEKELESDLGLFDDENTENSKIKLYVNVPLGFSVEEEIRKAKDGIASKDIVEIFGIPLKQANKLLKFITTGNDKYVITDVVEYKSTIYKYYTKEKYEEMKSNKLKRLKGDIKATDVSHISNSERQQALEILCEKYKAFILDKPIIEELTLMTGHKHAFDKKNLINIAKKSNIKIYEFLVKDSTKMVLHSPEISPESPIVQNLVRSFFQNCDKSFEKVIKYYFVNHTSFAIHDNLFPLKIEFSYKNLYDYLKSLNKQSFKFDYEIIKEMTLEKFLSINKVCRMHFRELVSEYIYRTSPSMYKEYNLKQDVIPNFSSFLFCSIEYRNKFAPIFGILSKLLEITDTFKIFDIRNKLPDYILMSVSNGFNPQSYITKLEWLNSHGFINFKKTDMLIEMIDLTDQELDDKIAMHINSSTGSHMEYKERCKFFSMIQHLERNNFIENCEKIIVENYEGVYRNILLNRLAAMGKFCFSTAKLTIEKEEFEKVLFDKEIYKFILKNILENNKISISLIYKKYPFKNLNEIINEVLLKMLENRAIPQLTTVKDLGNLRLSSLFINHMKISTENIKFSTDNYYEIYFSKIYKVVKENISIDFDNLLKKLKVLDKFELLEFLEFYKDEFSVFKYSEFMIISLPESQEDPFL